MAAWMTPCSSWIVNEAGTSTRRQIIGLMPSRRIFSCRIGPAGEVKVRRVLPGITDLGRWPPQATQPQHLALPAPHALWRSPAALGLLPERDSFRPSESAVTVTEPTIEDDEDMVRIIERMD